MKAAPGITRRHIWHTFEDGRSISSCGRPVNLKRVMPDGKVPASSRCPKCNWPAPFQRHSPTSREAADLETGNLRSRVLRYIEERGGATDEEAQLALGMSPSTQRPRRVELVQSGAVRDSGRTRPTRSGRQAVVWEVVR